MNQTNKTGNEETRQRIIDAAINCVKRWGVDKTNLNDIAREAGVTRPTVYSYFSSREDVVQTALLESGYGFAEALIAQVEKFDSSADRVLEAIMYAWEYLPEEPYLTLVTKSEMAQMVNEQALSSPEGREICRSLFNIILKNSPELLAEVDEIAEFSTRILLSLLMIEGEKKRSPKQMRSFLTKRLLPAIGL